MANKTVTVKPTGGTYTTLAAAIAGELTANANLVTMAGILTISIEGDWSSGADSTFVDVNGFTTNSSYYVKITTDSANRAKASAWDETRYRLSLSNAMALQVRDDYVWVDGLQISVPSVNAANQHAVYVTGIAATNNLIQFSNCRITGDTDTATKHSGIVIGDTDCIANIWNCIISDFGVGVSDSNGIQAGGATVNVYNCTIYGCYNGLRKAAGTLNIYDSAVLNNADDFSGTPSVISYCASDDNDTTDASNVAEDGGGADWTGDFTDGSGGNWTLLSTSNLVGAASRAGSGVFSTDIDGTTRGAAWDVGAHEYVAASTTANNRVVMVI